jgi:hypothetical protein
MSQADATSRRSAMPSTGLLTPSTKTGPSYLIPALRRELSALDESAFMHKP